MVRSPWASTSAPLGAWLVLTLGVAFLLLGSVRPPAQALLHVLICVGALLASHVPDRRLGKAGVVLGWAFAALPLLGALALGFLYVPAAMAAWVAPGRLLARPGAAWVSLAADVGRVPGEISTLILVVGFGALVAVWGVASHRRSSLENAIVAMVGILAASMLVHAALGATSMLGVLSPREPGGIFFAPLVNPDHSASVMVLGGLVAVGASLDASRTWWYRLGASLVFVMAVAVIVWAGSVGAEIAGLGALVFWAVSRRTRFAVPLVVLALSATVGVQIWAALCSWDHEAFAGRAVLWRDSLHLIRDHWLTGVGGGNFGEAIRSYRTDMAFGAPVHAHDDILEWVAETGFLGIIAVALAVAAFRPGPLRDPRRAGGLLAGGLGLVLHAFVDFPLQIPAIAMALAGLAACLVSTHSPSRPVDPRSVRRLILAVGLMQIPAAAWQAREAWVAHAIEDLEAYSADPGRGVQAARNLALVGARGPERLLAQTWEAERAGDTAEAIESALSVGQKWPDRPDALRAAALVLARARQYPMATDLLNRSVDRDPSDRRPWVLLARVSRANGDDFGAADHWREAFRRGETHIDEAWETLPVAIYWLDAFEHDAALCAAFSQFLLAKGECEVALLASEQAERLDRAAYGRHLPRAMILLQLGRAAEAEAWLKPILADTPDNPDALAVYAQALAAQGRHDEATEAWVRVSRERPTLRPMALRSAEAAGGLERALNLAHRFEVDGGVDPETGLEIAHLRQRSGNPAACVQAIERWSILPGSLREQAEQRLESCRKDMKR